MRHVVITWGSRGIGRALVFFFLICLRKGKWKDYPIYDFYFLKKSTLHPESKHSLIMNLNFLDLLATFMVLFAIIDILGSITTLLSLRTEYHSINISIALSLNMIIVYLVLRLTSFFERILGPSGLHILRKFFGIILPGITIRLFLSNTGVEISKGM